MFSPAHVQTGLIDASFHTFLGLQFCWTFHAVANAGGLLALALVDGTGTPMPVPALLLAVYQAAMEGVPAEQVHAHVQGMTRSLREQLEVGGQAEEE